MKTSSTKYYDEIAGSYDNGYKKPYWDIYNAVTWSYIKECLPGSKKDSLILDAGGGTGFWSIIMAKLGYKVVLTDISSGMLDAARDNIAKNGVSGNIEVITADITDMRMFGNGAFDLSIAEGDPVSYCRDPDRAIGELSRVTKTGGYVTVSVDNKLTWALRNIRSANYDIAEEVINTGIAYMQANNGEQYPAYTFTFDELKELFVKNGLKPVKYIGKPVFITDQDLNDRNVYEKLLGLEMKYSANTFLSDCGGHIALVGIKTGQ